MSSRALAKARKQHEYYSLLQLRLYEVVAGEGNVQCEACGYVGLHALHLHHPDPTIKSRKFNQRTWSPKDLDDPRFMLELRGCQLLCANCHATHHYSEQVKKLYGAD